MRSGQCDYCGAETSHGLALCTGCQGMLVMLLEYVPIYFRNLSRWRPSSLASDRKSAKSKRLIDEMVTVLETGRPLSGPRALDVATSTDRIAALLGDAHADLTGWMRTLADGRPELARVIARILTFEDERAVRLSCALLTKRVMTLTTLPWVRDLVHGVMQLERRLRVETERAVPGWYAGECGTCSTKTFVLPGFHWVTCRGCGAMSAARDHLPTIIEEARWRTAPPKRMAEILVALLDDEHSVHRLYERIVKWGARGRITALRDTARDHVFDGEQIVVATVEVGRARYRFGEVVDRLAVEGATRERIGA